MPTITIDNIQGWLANLLNGAPRDWVANECLANAPAYAKPDAEKVFVLWEAEGPSIEIQAVDGIQRDHPWLYRLFVIDGTPGSCQVRFPYNIWDARLGYSISPVNLVDNRTMLASQDVRVIRRWSSASRSCFALIPRDVPQPVQINAWEGERKPAASGVRPCVNQPEWEQNARVRNRFHSVVGGHLGDFCGPRGRQANGDNVPSRLYSVKTGVSYVGSMFEEGHHKNLLEANAAMAIVRSNVIKRVEEQRPQNQRTDRYRVQIELLTVTAECDIAETGVRRDGFQVRDLSCMKNGESYIPGHAIPYNGRTFSNANGAADCRFWIENFAIPCGQAKARMFLDYGLIHSSANAQNFIVAFRNNGFAGFILRDIGDTYWHDDYIENHLGTAHPAYASGVQVERGKAHKHLLHQTTSNDYPSPHLVRVAAYSVITHGFAEKLMRDRGWSDRHVLQFTQAILSGFRDYVIEKTGFPGVYPAEPNYHLRHDFLQLGRVFAYPRGNYTQDDVEHYLDNHSEDTLQLAATVRQRSADILRRAGDKLQTINQLIDAEEMALCGAIELYLRNRALSRRLEPRGWFRPWATARTHGRECSTCHKKHGSFMSTMFGRWHLCTSCGRNYCSNCGDKLAWAGIFTRTRRCPCGGQTALVE